MSDTANLKSLGSGKTEYKLDKPCPEVLETFNNKFPNNFYLVPFVMEHDEFTSLCPKTGQPDQAKIEICYVPKEKLVESKSLKLYLFSFRNHGSFHEDICNTIADTLFELLQPQYLRVFGSFTPRGGLAIKPMVVKSSGSLSANAIEDIQNLVLNWDCKR